MLQFILPYFLPFIISLFASTVVPAEEEILNPPFQNEQAAIWADSVYHNMTNDERIGQLFMVAAWSNKGEAHINEIEAQINKNHIGGLIFFQGGPKRQVKLINRYQSISKIPLLIGMDAEWGLSMRLDSTVRFPRQMTIGAANIPDDVYSMGKEIANHCKLLGVHINFAPVVDINNNPLNPVINSRSFGENREDVTKLSMQYMMGMQDQGVLACAKHFPGHGNADADSHFDLPVINQPPEVLDSIELFPYKKLFKKGLASVMVAHISVPAMDSTKNLAATLSPYIVRDLLKDSLKFEGLIITDALNMKGVSKYFKPGKLEVAALQAGNDLLLFPEDVPQAIKQIKRALATGNIDSSWVEHSVKKILRSKYFVGLNKFDSLSTDSLYEKLNNPSAKHIRNRIYNKAITVLRNNDSIIPFQRTDTFRIASLTMNASKNDNFQKELNQFTNVDAYRLSKHVDQESVNRYIDKLKNYDHVILSLHNISTNASKNFNLTPQMASIAEALASETSVILCVFGNPYSIDKMKNIENVDVVILSYEDTGFPRTATAQIIFGALAAKGTLPVKASKEFNYKAGIITGAKPNRLQKSDPEETGFNTIDFDRIDSIMQFAIDTGATPGAQILIAVDGKIIFNKNYGYHTYDSILPVLETDVYDIASVTKIAATAMAMMKIYEEGKINLDEPIVRYLPELKNTNKENIKLRDMLTHQAGLISWIPFWVSTVDKGTLSDILYKKSDQGSYCIRLSDDLYLKYDYPDEIWQEIVNSEMKEEPEYKYSDLGLIISKRIIERITGMPFEDYLYENFYNSLDLQRFTFRPREKFLESEIVPTEMDTSFRNCLVWGDVHDPAAAMMEGVGGHAGIFSNAYSLAVIMQLFLNGGDYAGQKYLKKNSIDVFTARQFPNEENRRGLIFDKPEPDTSKAGPACLTANLIGTSYGHSGFTGTYAWADPDFNMVYIFLSNRIHPDANNRLLVDLNIRTEIQQVIYDALLAREEKFASH